MKVFEGKVIVSVEIRKGRHTWNKAYGFYTKDLPDFTIERFKARVHEDAKQLIADQSVSDTMLRRIEDHMQVEIMLD